MLARLYRHLDGSLPVIGVGGIASVEQAWAKIEAGASAIQIYSALIYQGFSLADRIARGLDARLEAEKITLADLTGSAADRWAA